MITGELLFEFFKKASQRKSSEKSILQILQLTKKGEGGIDVPLDLKETVIDVHKKYVQLLIQNKYLPSNLIGINDLSNAKYISENYTKIYCIFR